MVGAVLTYLAGVLLGELGLMFWWGMKAARPVTPGDYVREKWAAAGFSAVLSIAMSIVWAEGALTAWLSEKLGSSVGVTIGTSLLSGFLVCFFAHAIIWKFKKKAGLDELEAPTPPPAGD